MKKYRTAILFQRSQTLCAALCVCMYIVIVIYPKLDCRQTLGTGLEIPQSFSKHRLVRALTTIQLGINFDHLYITCIHEYNCVCVCVKARWFVERPYSPVLWRYVQSAWALVCVCPGYRSPPNPTPVTKEFSVLYV